MSAKRNESGEKWCTYGKGHWASPERFYKNATKPDGLNDICLYHQGVVDDAKRTRAAEQKK
ncbi:hypothetical protein [Hyalangium sp.]|uniref:hypothetical protein n=1 Tax=Hyalangium sp. TaxID=2028555 RepID=UPI002D2D005F|nr:hypothetical protein [Hyalangium sp.]HYI02722.1 hypothetical protein [Hyalangium sp.]